MLALTPAVEQRKNVVKSVIAPRIASLDRMRRLANMSRQGIGKKLADFEVACLLPDSVVGEGRVTFPKGCSQIASGNSTPNMLVVCSDRQSNQLCSSNFVIYRAGLNISFICGPAHDGWNAVLEDLTRNGFMAVVVAAQLLFNVA